VFPFFADAHNLERITPPWLRFRVLTPPPIAMGEGALIAYRLRLHGLPLRWLTRITGWDPPHEFVDEQLRGPYRLWRHRHTFAPDGEGTLARDRVDYELRGTDAMQDAAQALLVRRDLERIFGYRGDRLAELYPPV
jgi:ligand-binding SRPBCC domain-containing protein